MEKRPYHIGKMLAEGKTKQVCEACTSEGVLASVGLDSLCFVVSKDDITAGDGKRHDVMEGKAVIATQTTVNIFELLKACGLPLAYEGPCGERAFIARECRMIPLEVIVRREAHGSYCRRLPHLKPHTRLPRLLVEFNLKTADKMWDGEQIPCDDPLIRWELPSAGDLGAMELFLPSGITYGAEPFKRLPWPSFCHEDDLDMMAATACRAFLILEKAWQVLGIRLVDYKVEFGHTTGGSLVLADVIDADSGRLVGPDGTYLDKQVYREGGTVEEVYRNYLKIQRMTERFPEPVSDLVLWKASPRDDLHLFREALHGLIPHAEPGSENIRVEEFACSAHKETPKALEKLRHYQQYHPNAVIIAYVGMSNGLGPVLAGNADLPVICVPKDAKQCPEDVWSSLRVPSNVPCSTVLSPANAVLHALQILARNNPALHMVLESRKAGYYEIG